MKAKNAHRSIFLAMQADAKAFPGGIHGLANALGRNGNTLGNQLNPEHDAAPPSMELLIEIISLCNAKRTVFALAQLADQITVDFVLEQRSPAEAVALFLSLMHTVGSVIGQGSEFAKDGRFDAGERRELEPLLLSLMKATGELLQSIR